MEEILKFKKANCKNCFKCLRECPVKAIAFKDGQAEILRDECLICGHCLTVCPQNAKNVRNDTETVKGLIKKGRVAASIAPSFAAAFATGFEEFSDALKKLGFSYVRETSEGAVPVTFGYERFIEERKMPCVISSACPTIVKLIEKYHPGAIPCLAPIDSPMGAHAKMLKRLYGDIPIVFIGPCISKKDESEWKENEIDAALTFEELEDWFESENILPGKAERTAFAPKNLNEYGNARKYPTHGGIIATMRARVPGVNYMTVDGVDKCRKVLEEIESGGLDGFFIEMSACAGSCINGPCMIHPDSSYLADYRRTKLYAESKKDNLHDESLWEGIDFTRRYSVKAVTRQKPGERDIREILARTGKTTPEKELNCGACGYPTCREKAIAVYEGKAEVEMCMPYMRERAEYVSDKVISFSPNAIIVLDSILSIKAVNGAACKLFGIKSAKDVAGKYIGELTDASAFEEALVRRENVLDRKIYLFRYDKYVEQSVIYVKEHNIIFAILRDLTDSEKQNENFKKVKFETVQTADNVIKKQMRVVQEIAMLLGETTAETKVALTKLKETLMSEEE